jgi:acetyl esterase/lipase
MSIVLVPWGADWGRLSRAERDAAYNNTKAVADSAVLNAAREVASSVFRSTNSMHLDLRYGKRERNTWDLFPVADSDAPCLVFIHGGYWHRNSKEQFGNLVSAHTGAYGRRLCWDTRWRPIHR